MLKATGQSCRGDLSTNFLTDDSVVLLTNGKWRLLKSLNLFENDIDLRGVAGLLTADCPALDQLYLGDNNFCRFVSGSVWPEADFHHIERMLSAKWCGITVSFAQLRNPTETSAGPGARRVSAAIDISMDSDREVTPESDTVVDIESETSVDIESETSIDTESDNIDGH